VKKSFKSRLSKKETQDLDFWSLLTKRRVVFSMDQLCFSVCHNSAGNLHEDFLDFVPVMDLSGQGLTWAVLDILESLTINLNKMVGQGYDGAAAASGHLSGLQAVIRHQYPKALYFNCSTQSLNLVFSSVCPIPAFKHIFWTLSQICIFYSALPLRTRNLKEKFNKLQLTLQQSLAGLCKI